MIVDQFPVTIFEMDQTDVQYRQDLILASAYFHTEPTKCARVLYHAMQAAGVWNALADELRSGLFHHDEECLAQFPVFEQWYSSLIELVVHKPTDERLLDGAGNFVGPAGASFTDCWLTPMGENRAKKLLLENPQWKPLLLVQK